MKCEKHKLSPFPRFIETGKGRFREVLICERCSKEFRPNSQSELKRLRAQLK